MRLIITTLFLLATCGQAAAAPLRITTEHLPPSSMIGADGAITGRAIYEGSLDFVAAQDLADKLNG